MSTYEERLSSNLEWALTEGSLYFEDGGEVRKSLRRIAQRLDEINVPYAVAGGLALFAHGFRRFTEDIDILVDEDTLKRIHEHLDGRGYLPPNKYSKNLKDTNSGVRIEFLLTGRYPGDGRPKPIAFPDPRNVSKRIEGIQYVDLSTLINLKLASGMTGGRDRSKDITDVVELLKILHLPEQFADTLDEYVRPTYLEIWHDLNHGSPRFVTSVEDGLHSDEIVQAMLHDGAVIEDFMSAKGLFPLLVTRDPDIAKKYGMTRLDEFFRQTNQD